MLNIIENCGNLEALSMACGFKRGGVVWGIDEDIARSLLSLLKLRRLEYVTANCRRLDEQLEKELWRIKGIEIQRITSNISVSFDNHGRTLITRNESGMELFPDTPVLMEQIVKGEVVYHSRFR